MAKPRIFVSSTYYDLKYVRAEIETFIRQMGYDPVLNERGQIPYSKNEKLEQSCYREINQCDILVSIIGGRYGSPSVKDPHSVSQIELKTAIDLEKSLYIFVDKSVYSEYQTYRKNKDKSDIDYHYVDNVEVFKFLDYVTSLPRNNPIFEFSHSSEITTLLKEQWSGLFQRLLSEQQSKQQSDLAGELRSSLKTLGQLVNYLTDERKQGDQAIRDILTTNHPAFDELRRLLGVRYRIFFSSRKELGYLLEANGFTPVLRRHWNNQNVIEYVADDSPTERKILFVDSSIFDDDGKIKTITPADWDPDFITMGFQIETSNLDDEIPF